MAELTDVRSEIGLDARIPLAVYVGDVKDGRNIEAIFFALELLPQWHIAIVGSAAWQLDKFNLSQRVSSRVLNRTHIVARRPDNELPDFLATADIGVFVPLPTSINLYHCAPNKFFSMAFAGIPLVVSNLPFMARTVRDFKVGHVVSAVEPRQIAQAMRVARSQKALILERRQSIVEAFGWSRQSETLLKTYAAALTATD